MTNDNELENLRAELADQCGEVAVLRQQVAYERKEREALQTIVLKAQGQLRQEITTAELSKAWFDEHLTELAASMGEGKDIAAVMEAQTKLLLGIVSVSQKLADRYDGLEIRIQNIENAILVRR